jgi:predicted dehydrogenase
MKYYRAPEYYKGSWRGTVKMDGGGALMNQGIHGVDLLLYLCGNVAHVQSSVRTLIHDIEVEDTAAALLEFECGALGVIEATTSVYPGFNRILEVCGSNGSLIMKEGRITRIVTRDGTINEERDIENSENASDPTKTDITLHKAQIESFIRAATGDESAEYCDGLQGRRAVDLIRRIYAASN